MTQPSRESPTPDYSDTLRAAARRGEPLTPYQRGYVHGYEQALAAPPEPLREGLDVRLSDCEDALSTVEAAYDALTPPTEGLPDYMARNRDAVHVPDRFATPPTEGLAALASCADSVCSHEPRHGFRATPPTEGLDVERLARYEPCLGAGCWPPMQESATGNWISLRDLRAALSESGDKP